MLRYGNYAILVDNETDIDDLFDKIGKRCEKTKSFVCEENLMNDSGKIIKL